MGFAIVPKETVFARRASAILYYLARRQPGSGGVYLIPANVCPVVPLALLKAGRRFEFIDIDPETLCMDEALLRARADALHLPPVAGLVYVRTYGFEADKTTLFQEVKTALPAACLIDDRCAARPEPDSDNADDQGADVLLYSTGYSKYVDLDFGGFAHIRQGVAYSEHEQAFAPDDLDGITRYYKHHINEAEPLYREAPPDATHPIWHYDRWLDTRPPDRTWREYRGSILNERNKSDARKTAYNAIYHAIIPASAQLPTGFQSWRFNIREKQKKALLSRIRQAGYIASDHYFPASRLFGGAHCPVAEALHHEVINLFNDFRVTAHQVEAVAKIVQDHVYQTHTHPTL